MVDQILQLKCTFIGSEMGGEIDCNKGFSRDKSGKNMHTRVTQMKQTLVKILVGSLKILEDLHEDPSADL